MEGLLKLEELQNKEDNWMDREGIDERQVWLEEGIQLYEQFLEIDPREPRYAVSLAKLYLEWGRDEKIRHGNHRRAYEILQRATFYAPNHPDAFYHLSFVLAKEERRWEAALFHAKEALENGIRGNQEIKLYCNAALAYARLGYLKKSLNNIKLARKLDIDHENEWFIQLYEDKLKKRKIEPILINESNHSRKAITKDDYESMKEKAMDGECLVLDLANDKKYFYAEHDAVGLEPREAEVLGFLIDRSGTVQSQKSIAAAIWHERNVNDSTVKRYISSVRRKIQQAIPDTDVSLILQTDEQGYVWKNPMDCYVLRRV